MLLGLVGPLERREGRHQWKRHLAVISGEWIVEVYEAKGTLMLLPGRVGHFPFSRSGESCPGCMVKVMDEE